MKKIVRVYLELSGGQYLKGYNTYAAEQKGKTLTLTPDGGDGGEPGKVLKISKDNLNRVSPLEFNADFSKVSLFTFVEEGNEPIAMEQLHQTYKIRLSGFRTALLIHENTLQKPLDDVHTRTV